MSNRPNSTFAIATIIVLTISSYLAYHIINHTLAYKNTKEAYAHSLNFESRLLNIDEWFDDQGTQEAKIKKAAIIAQEASAYQAKGKQFAWFFVAITFAYLLLVYFWLGKGSKRIYRLSMALIAVALSCLVVGLFTPMLEIGAYQRDLSIPIKIKPGSFPISLDFTQHFAGDIYFYYQSKSVVELIQVLFEQRNLIVGISILLFSVVIPVGKLSLSLWALFRPNLFSNRFIALFINQSGKWSMADVFVVAVFLSFLAFANLQTGLTTESNVLLGLYFFFAYVVLSIILAVFIGKHHQNQ